ncbi:MAG: hypothetical protein ACI9G1_001138 [Pirellulaceae bacterium]|jgi:hypothetical protein
MKITLNWNVEPLATVFYLLLANLEIEPEPPNFAKILWESGKTPPKISDLALAYLTDEPTEPAVSRIEDLRAACSAAWPHLAAELSSRQRPLREQWEARGPGMIHFLSQRQLLPAGDIELPLYLLKPLVGGGGFAINSPRPLVGFEALLANPSVLVPETVRLCWYVLQAVTKNDPEELLAWAIR